MEIPGYRIQREIGRGVDTRVFVGLQNAFGRQVAIKVLSQASARDAGARERFLSEARVGAELDHPNIVRVIDAGVSGDVVYRVMEYLRGGDLNANLETGLHLQNVLMVVNEVAAALDHAHGKGVAHGRVKPGNILFNEQGTARLSDFGIAVGSTRAVYAPQATGESGSYGAPEYMSAEQAAGDAIDGRSDFYSLGVVFYEALTGRLPFSPVSESAARYPHGKIPPLPLQLASFEVALERFLAESPEQRFQSAEQIVLALDEIRNAGLVPDAVVKNGPVTSREMTAVDERPERHGTLGSADAGPARPRRVFAITAGLTIACALVAGGFYLGTQEDVAQRALAIAGVVEHPDVVLAWQAAEKLRLDPNQGLGAIVAAYRRVLGLEARQGAALDAIAALAGQWKQETDALIDGDDFGLALAKLNELASVFPEDPDLTTLFDQLADSRRAQRLLADTNRQLAHSGLGDARSVDYAIVHYKEVLRLRPGNSAALAALDDIAVFYGALARDHAVAGDLAVAMENLERAVAANTEFQGIEEVRARLTDAEALQAEIDDMLRTAGDLRQAGALIEPPGSNATEVYSSVLAIRPDDAVALQGLAGIVGEVLASFDTMLAARRLDEAKELLERAAASGIGDQPVDGMNARFDAELARIETVRNLIREAEALFEKGYVTGPALEDNAVARLREAQRLDPANADAGRLMSMAATRLAKTATDAYVAGMTEEGLLYLDLALTVSPGSSRWRERRQRWQAEEERSRSVAAEEAGSDEPFDARERGPD